jgi:hypothetical protein
MNFQSGYDYVSYNIDTNPNNNTSINAKSVQTKRATYKMLYYDTKYVCTNDTITQLYRSLVLSPEQNHLLSFSPPKSMDIDEFIKKNPKMDSKIWANEFVEGTMINLFYDERIQSWEISTKGSVGGNYWFYRTDYTNLHYVDKTAAKQSTFREMFLDVFRCRDRDVNEIAFLENLPKYYSYSFVLQHSENHIVLPIKEAKLYLVAVYEISETRATGIPPCIYEEWDCFFNIRGIIDFPERYNHNNDNMSYEMIRANHCSIQSRYDKVGVMFTNMETGTRASMKNPVYDEVKKLRGNNPNLQYQYLCLLRIGKINDFLKYFPMYKRQFNRFQCEIADFITNVHKSYISQYIHKKNMVPISKKYHVHIWRLHHQIYLPSLSQELNKGSKRIITRYAVKQYFDEMEPRSMLYYLHYEDRQKMETDLVVDEPPF